MRGNVSFYMTAILDGGETLIAIKDLDELLDVHDKLRLEGVKMVALSDARTGKDITDWLTDAEDDIK